MASHTTHSRSGRGPRLRYHIGRLVLAGAVGASVVAIVWIAITAAGNAALATSAALGAALLVALVTVVLAVARLF